MTQYARFGWRDHQWLWRVSFCSLAVMGMCAEIALANYLISSAQCAARRLKANAAFDPVAAFALIYICLLHVQYDVDA